MKRKRPKEPTSISKKKRSTRSARSTDSAKKKKTNEDEKEPLPPSKSVSKDRQRLRLPNTLPTDYKIVIPTAPVGRPTIHNVLSTVKLECKLDLKKICTRCRNAEYNPRRFNAVIMRIQDPKATAIIWESGTLCVNGTSSEALNHKASRKFCKILQELGFNAKFRNYKTCNVLGKIDLRVPINLEELSLKHKDIASYEPELFPGVIMRLNDPKVTVFIFVSGNLVFTGARSSEQINQAYRNVFSRVMAFSFKS